VGKNLVWFGEIERKLAKLSTTTFTYRSSSYLFHGAGPRFLPLPSLSLILSYLNVAGMVCLFYG
jgi:hypothetical protein